MPTTEELLGIGTNDKSEEQHYTTKIKWNDKEYPILHEHSMNVLADRVLHGLEVNQYQNMNVVGKSGTGKTTFVQNFLHHIHAKQKRPFNIQWYHRQEIHNLDKIIANLQQGIPQILILDDISYEMEDLPIARKREIFRSLSTIRHQVKSQILVILINHYSRSSSKFVRQDSDWTVLLSLSTAELDNWIDIFGKQASWKLKTFQRQWAHSQMKGSFIINTPHREQPLIYATNKPFRIALVNELGINLHPVLFVDESCNFCRFQKQSREKLDANVLWQQFEHAYGNKARDVLQWFSYFHKGVQTALPDNKKRALNFLLKLLANHDVDMEKLMFLAENSKRYGKKTKSHYKQQYERMTNKILQESNLTKEQSRVVVGFCQLFV